MSTSTPHSLNHVAFQATLHCLTGCAIGEISGLIIGTAFHFSSLALAFAFGFGLSSSSLLRAGLSLSAALPLVFAADSLSIATMEIADNSVMALIPGAMNADLTNPLFWITMPVSLGVAFLAAYPVNKYLLKKNKGHALLMKHHDHTT